MNSFFTIHAIIAKSHNVVNPERSLQASVCLKKVSGIHSWLLYTQPVMLRMSMKSNAISQSDKDFF